MLVARIYHKILFLDVRSPEMQRRQLFQLLQVCFPAIANKLSELLTTTTITRLILDKEKIEKTTGIAFFNGLRRTTKWNHFFLVLVL